MAGWRQPVPAWRARQIAQREAARDTQFQEQVVGPVTGLDGSPIDEHLPIAQTEHHAVGKQFVLAGNAVFTLCGRDQRFTYRVRKVESTNPRYPEPTYFVSVLTGRGEDERRYTYVGILQAGSGRLVLTKGSLHYNEGSKVVVAFRWAMGLAWAGRDLPAPAAIYHEGRCGRCGRPLTDPDSILRGFGPDCWDLVQGGM